MIEAESWQKEQFSTAYVHALATVARCVTATWRPDKDGVDLTLRRGGISVDLQLKCTQAPRAVSDGYSFDLDIPTYDKLRARLRSSPGFLVLVIVPSDASEWIGHNPRDLLLRCEGFYAQIQNCAKASGSKTTAIFFPHSQALNAPAIDEMFDLALKRVIEGVGSGEEET